MTTPDKLLQEHLRQLPDAPLPADLWQRVNGARGRMRRRRIGLAATTLAVAAVVALSPLMRSPAPDASRAAQPMVATGPVTPDPAAVEVELRAIDRALQAGYARNATDDELEPLWAQRQRLLAGNDDTSKNPQPRGLRI
jgi:hypothetical protein